jgi:hypothetical protein
VNTESTWAPGRSSLSDFSPIPDEQEQEQEQGQGQEQGQEQDPGVSGAAHCTAGQDGAASVHYALWSCTVHCSQHYSYVL